MGINTVKGKYVNLQAIEEAHSFAAMRYGRSALQVDFEGPNAVAQNLGFWAADS